MRKEMVVRALLGAGVPAALMVSAYWGARGSMALASMALGELPVSAREDSRQSEAREGLGKGEGMAERRFEPVARPRVPSPIVIGECRDFWATIVSESSDPDLAMVALKMDSEPRARLCRVGDVVAGWRVELIGFNARDRTPSVWFSRGQSACRLDLFAQPAKVAVGTGASAQPARTPSAVPKEIAARIRRTSENEFVLDRSVFDWILEGPNMARNEARILPELRDGRVIGVRLLRVRADGILGLLGLREGDLLQTVNGFDITNPEKALEAYARLRTASRIEVRIERNRQARSIEYSIE